MKYFQQYYCLYYKLFFILFISSSILIYRLSFNNNLCQNDLKKYFFPNTKRIAFAFGTRPEAIKLFPLLKELKENKNFICITINTGQHKEMIQKILKSLNMDNSIDFNLNIMTKNQSLAKLTSKTILELDKLYSLINPDAVIVQGDTTTAFAAAISAFYQKIPIFHVEAGLRTHNLYYPFPEEFNRITIDDISTLYFAPTEWSASNLVKENKHNSNIFVTGNTIVDSLQITLNNTSPSEEIKTLIEKSQKLCIPHNNCKIILLTCHRRENYFQPINNIIMAIQKLLKIFNNIVVIFPFHLNPNVKLSIKSAIPNEVYDKIIKGEKITNINYLHFNRLIMIPPLNYFDLIHLESASYFIMSDSGGIQEEAVSIGKPILILRENTERPEAIKAGCGFLTGTSIDKIYYYASSLITNENLYNNISKYKNIYGNGNSRIIISQIIQNFFKNISQEFFTFKNLNYNDILSHYDNSILKNNNNSIDSYISKDIYDIVIVLTVWKRNNIESQLIQVKNQSILKNKKTNIIIFQNSNHIYISDIIENWKKPGAFSDMVDITFIQSPIETGYFGRFLIPLTSKVESSTYFFICDDDVIWGNRYFENMLRIVNEGFLATRNGRIIMDTDGRYITPAKLAWRKNIQVCFDEDIEYDFGGHIWAGRISWLRNAWNHIPVSFENSEDFWISAALKSFYNISTKSPKCPCPKGEPIIPDMCAASDKSSIKHEDAKIGYSTISAKIRLKIMEETISKFNYQLLKFSKPGYTDNLDKKFIYKDLSIDPIFNLTDDMWKNVLFWQ